MKIRRMHHPISNAHPYRYHVHVYTMPSTFANRISKKKRKEEGHDQKGGKKSKQTNRQQTNRHRERIGINKDRQRQPKTDNERERTCARNMGRQVASRWVNNTINNTQKRVQNHMHGLNKVLFLNAPTSSSMNGKEYEYPVHL